MGDLRARATLAHRQADREELPGARAPLQHARAQRDGRAAPAARDAFRGRAELPATASPSGAAAVTYKRRSRSRSPSRRRHPPRATRCRRRQPRPPSPRRNELIRWLTSSSTVASHPPCSPPGSAGLGVIGGASAIVKARGDGRAGCAAAAARAPAPAAAGARWRHGPAAKHVMVKGLEKWRPAKLPKRLKLKPVVRHGPQGRHGRERRRRRARRSRGRASTAAQPRRRGRQAQGGQAAQGACEAQAQESASDDAEDKPRRATVGACTCARPRPAPGPATAPPAGSAGCPAARRASAAADYADRNRRDQRRQVRRARTLTATWTGADPATTTYQWQLCDPDGKACQPIPSETNPTYVLKATTSADGPGGRRLRHVFVDLAGDRSDRARTAEPMGRYTKAYTGMLAFACAGSIVVAVRRTTRPRRSATSTRRPIAGRRGPGTSACETSAPTRASTRSPGDTVSLARQVERSQRRAQREIAATRSLHRTVVIGAPDHQLRARAQARPVAARPSAATRQPASAKRRTAARREADDEARSRYAMSRRRATPAAPGGPARAAAPARHGDADRPGRARGGGSCARQHAAAGRGNPSRRQRRRPSGHRAGQHAAAIDHRGAAVGQDVLGRSGNLDGAPRASRTSGSAATPPERTACGRQRASPTLRAPDIDKTMRVAVEATNAPAPPSPSRRPRPRRSRADPWGMPAWEWHAMGTTWRIFHGGRVRRRRPTGRGPGRGRRAALVAVPRRQRALAPQRRAAHARCACSRPRRSSC